MQLHFDRPSEANHLTAYGPGYFVVNEVRLESSIIVSRDFLLDDWPAQSAEDLTVDTIEGVLDKSPEVVIIGTGGRQQFPDPRLLAPLTEARVGFEVMGTGAACRTYNVLLSENREVIALLMLVLDQD